MGIMSKKELGVETRRQSLQRGEPPQRAGLLIASVQELEVRSRDAINRVCTGVRITPMIKRRSLNEISLLFV